MEGRKRREGGGREKGREGIVFSYLWLGGHYLPQRLPQIQRASEMLATSVAASIQQQVLGETEVG